MAPKRPKGVPSDRHLQKLWREAVLLEWGGKCALESMDCQGTRWSVITSRKEGCRI